MERKGQSIGVGRATCQPPSRVNQIGTQLEEMGENLRSVTETVNNLEISLSGVLRSTGPELASKGQVETQQELVPIASMLRNSNEAILNLRYRIEDLIARIEI